MEQLLDEALMAPVDQWNLTLSLHIIKQFKARLAKIQPASMRDLHAKAIAENIAAFRKSKTPVVVGDGPWMMPFPFHWRLLGENSAVNTIIGPSETIAVEWAVNPFLPKIHQSHWREIYR